jgi:hypothetical protein
VAVLEAWTFTLALLVAPAESVTVTTSVPGDSPAV